MTTPEAETVGCGRVTAMLRFCAPVDSAQPFVDLPVSIHDGRRNPERRSLDREGFMLARHFSQVRNFFDPEEVTTLYYGEIEKYVQDLTGARFVRVFTHAVRCSSNAPPAGGVQRPFKFVHNDYTADSGPTRAHQALGTSAGGVLNSRFSIVNVWRPIRGPVLESPLAVCDSMSVGNRDMVSLPSQDPSGNFLRIYSLAFNPAQRWSYFPQMQREEVLMFKTFDSLNDGRARFTFHSAFADPDTPRGAPPRESIEVRALAVFA